MKRTDAQKLAKQGVTVSLGGENYILSPKSVNHSRLWKEKARETVEDFHKLSSMNLEDSQQAISAVKSFLFEVQDELIDLIFEWETEWPKDHIMDTATEDELFDVAIQMIAFAFPLVKRLGIMNNLKSPQNTK